MKKMFSVLAASVFGFASIASAQTALDAAKQRDICNGAPVVSAEFLANGNLKVVCPCNSVTAEGVAAKGATLITDNNFCGVGLGPAPGAALLGMALLVAVAGSDDTSTTTTTTTTTTTGTD